ncbi:uncharacterized protein LOC141531466, partial [Cotesia typhae]|uniref:uncharacterized protein LOC141531466 n=1 Tax=Cotesia typhae TaxID=2053667 RepID=UPI003D6829D7
HPSHSTSSSNYFLSSSSRLGIIQSIVSWVNNHRRYLSALPTRSTASSSSTSSSSSSSLSSWSSSEGEATATAAVAVAVAVTSPSIAVAAATTVAIRVNQYGHQSPSQVVFILPNY